MVGSKEGKAEREMLFYAGLLHELFLGQVPQREVGTYLRQIARQEVEHPNGQIKAPSISTLRRKWRAFQKESIDGLRRKGRSDKGKPRKIAPHLLEIALAAKREEPRRTVATLIDLLMAQEQVEVKRSTLYRHLQAHGATRMQLGAVKKPVRKRWTIDVPGGMWVGDFAHGPKVIANGVVRKTYLSVFIDAHSRLVVAARYYWADSFDILIDTLLRGFMLYGRPRALYVDNGKVYWAQSLRLACYRLKIDLLHRPVRDPAPGGVVERFIQTVQQQFEVEARLESHLTLERLNTAFHAWLEGAYHRRVHSETGATPLEKYGPMPLVDLDISEVRKDFLQSEKRTVDRTFADIRLNSHFYRVEQRLRGSRVEVRYDPFGDVRIVSVYSIPGGKYLCDGELHERQVGEKVEVPPRPQLESSVILDSLIEQQKQRMKDDDFRPAANRKVWPLSAFLQTLAKLLGRREGLCAFSEDENSILAQVHARHPDLTRAQVQAVVASMENPTILEIIWAIDNP